MRGQTRIGGVGDLNQPDPTANVCEWCEKPAVASLPLQRRVPGKRNARVLSGMNVYFCNDHQGSAERFTAEPL